MDYDLNIHTCMSVCNVYNIYIYIKKIAGPGQKIVLYCIYIYIYIYTYTYISQNAAHYERFKIKHFFWYR